MPNLSVRTAWLSPDTVLGAYGLNGASSLSNGVLTASGGGTGGNGGGWARVPGVFADEGTAGNAATLAFGVTITGSEQVELQVIDQVSNKRAVMFITGGSNYNHIKFERRDQNDAFVAGSTVDIDFAGPCNGVKWWIVAGSPPQLRVQLRLASDGTYPAGDAQGNVVSYSLPAEFDPAAYRLFVAGGSRFETARTLSIGPFNNITSQPGGATRYVKANLGVVYHDAGASIMEDNAPIANGDKLIIGNGTTLKQKTGTTLTLGDGTAGNVAIQTDGVNGTGIFEIEDGCTFNMDGHVQHGPLWKVGGNCTVNMRAGFYWTAGRAVGQNAGVMFDAMGKAKTTIKRVSGPVGAVTAFRNCAPGKFDESLGTGKVVFRNCNVTDIGSQDEPMVNYTAWHDPKALTWEDTTFTRCAGLYCVSNVNADWTFKGIKTIDSIGTHFNSVNGKSFLSATSSSGTLTFERCVFDSNVRIGAYWGNLKSNNNVWGREPVVNYDTNVLEWDANLVVKPGYYDWVMGGTGIYNRTYVLSLDTGENPHFTGGHGLRNQTIRGMILDSRVSGGLGGSPDHSDGDGIGIVNRNAGAVIDFNVEQVLVLPANNGNSPCTLITTAAPQNMRIHVRHCTYMTGSKLAGTVGALENDFNCGIQLHENQVGASPSPADLLYTFDGNIGYTPRAGTGLFARHWYGSGGRAGIGNAPKNLVRAAGIGNNALTNPRTNITDRPDVTQDHWDVMATTKLKGATITSDPQFVDSTRNIVQFGKLVAGLGATPTELQVVDWVGQDPSTRIVQLYNWVRAGFVPQNPAYKSAAADGGDLGAVAMSADVEVPTADALRFIDESVVDPIELGTVVEPNIQVEAIDTSLDVRDTSYTGAVTISIEFSLPSGVRITGGTVTVNAVAGVATFDDIVFGRVVRSAAARRLAIQMIRRGR